MIEHSSPGWAVVAVLCVALSGAACSSKTPKGEDAADTGEPVEETGDTGVAPRDLGGDSADADGMSQTASCLSVTSGTPCSPDGARCEFGEVECGPQAGEPATVYTCKDGRWEVTKSRSDNCGADATDADAGDGFSDVGDTDSARDGDGGADTGRDTGGDGNSDAGGG